MSAQYELWLTDDSGRRLVLLRDYSYFSYSRSVIGLGTFECAIPLRSWKEQMPQIFSPDWRIDLWRSPNDGIPMRRECVFFLRLKRVYTRVDGVQMIQLYGRDTKDLLNRRWIIQPAGYSQTSKEEPIDDMMKAIVREQMLWGSSLDADAVADNSRAWPENEFTVAADLSLGPTLAQNFPDQNVLDVLKNLRDATFQLYDEDSLSYRKIYFDVVPYDMSTEEEAILDEETSLPIEDEIISDILDESSIVGGVEMGFRFETYADLYGSDRTDGVIFSVENNNMKDPYYSVNHMEEVNAVIVKGFGRGDSRSWEEVSDASRVNQSRWNRCEAEVDASTEPDQSNLADYGYSRLYLGRPIEELDGIFMNVLGSDDTPQSLYGIDWDLGDIVPVEYAGERLDSEILIVYVSVSENGTEKITGRNKVGA